VTQFMKTFDPTRTAKSTMNERKKAGTASESASIRTPEQLCPCLTADLVVGRVTRGERLPLATGHF
jgi:hypothetical protein